MKNINPKKYLTNNIQLSMVLPVAKVIIECDLKGDANDEEKQEIQYRDYIVKTVLNILKFEDLYSNYEYKAECKIFFC